MIPLTGYSYWKYMLPIFIKCLRAKSVSLTYNPFEFEKMKKCNYLKNKFERLNTEIIGRDIALLFI